MAFPFWLNVNPTTGKGPGSSTVTVLPNSGRDRSYMLTINGSVNGFPATSTAMVTQEGTYKAIDNLQITSDGVAVNTTEQTDDGTTLYEISNSDWESKDNIKIDFKTNAAAYRVQLLPIPDAPNAGAAFNVSVGTSIITYIDNNGKTMTTPLVTSSTVTRFETRSGVLPYDFDPGINGSYTLSFNILPKEFNNTSSVGKVCGVRLEAYEELNGDYTVVAEIGTVYPGITGVTPSFADGGGDELNVPESGTTSTLNIDCANDSTWTIE